MLGSLTGAGTHGSRKVTRFKNGDKMQLELDTDKGTLVAYKGGVRLSQHITGLQGRALCAFVTLHCNGDRLRITPGSP